MPWLSGQPEFFPARSPHSGLIQHWSGSQFVYYEPDQGSPIMGPHKKFRRYRNLPEQALPYDTICIQKHTQSTSIHIAHIRSAYYAKTGTILTMVGHRWIAWTHVYPGFLPKRHY